MLSSYRDLNSITQTLGDAVDPDDLNEQNIYLRKERGEKTPLKVEEQVESEPTKSIAIWKKALFGFGNFSRYTVIGIQAYFLNVFLLEVASIGTFWAGNILLIKQIYDGITDPMVGKLSDSFNTRWGRRKPWILLASIPSGIFWVLQWYTPRFVEGENGLTYAILYYTAILMIFSTLNTFVSVPYNAMVPDVAVNYHDRTTVVLFQEVFGLTSVILFSYIQAETVEFFPEEDNPHLVDYEKGYLVASLITVWAVVLPMIVAVIFIRERSVAEVNADENYEGRSILTKIVLWFWYFVKSLVKSLLFKQFTLIVIVFVMSMIAVYIFVNNFVLFVKYVLRLESHTSFLMLEVQATATLSLFFWAFVSKQIGKKLTFLCGAVLWIGGSVVMFFVGEDDMAFVYAINLLRASGSGVGFLIPLAMLPDIIAMDRIVNNQKREGVLYSLMILLQKTGVGIGLTASNYILGWAGYENPDKESTLDAENHYQPDSVLLSLRILTCIVPIVCLIIAMICLAFINIPEDLIRAEEIGEAQPVTISRKYDDESDDFRSKDPDHLVGDDW